MNLPALALIDLAGPKWLPPLPVFLFLLWPLVWTCQGLAWLIARDRPTTAQKLRLAMQAFGELRGLEIDVEGRDHAPIHIRFV